ncbi:YacL family protein [Arsenophonus endosymbiont of Aleurodicus dispersus]|nr:YacL family protein [Arsenophonus endosymbiont of Aleurodicus dispersus]
MDYKFRQNITSYISACFSMDNEAISYWLNEQFKGYLCPYTVFDI